MTSSPLLLVEDEEDHAALFRELYEETGLEHELVHAPSLSAACDIAQSTNPWAVVLDLGLPDAVGLDAIEALERRLPGTPLIVLTADSTEAVSIEAIRNGAQDYLVKGHLTPERLNSCLRYAVERNKMWLDLDQKNREIEAFAAMASHDLRSPLGRILQSAELLQELIDVDGDAEILLRGLHTDAERLQRLVDDILRFARLGSAGLRLETFPFVQAVRGAMTLLDPAIGDASVVLADDLPVVVADEGLLETLLQNLLANSLRYTREEQTKIWISSEEDADFYVFRVRDNGIGIPDTDVERIFEPLARAVSCAQYQGSGLGLAACRKIVEAHRGKIWAVPGQETGAVICFTIPRIA